MVSDLVKLNGKWLAAWLNVLRAACVHGRPKKLVRLADGTHVFARRLFVRDAPASWIDDEVQTVYRRLLNVLAYFRVKSWRRQPRWRYRVRRRELHGVVEFFDKAQMRLNARIGKDGLTIGYVYDEFYDQAATTVFNLWRTHEIDRIRQCPVCRDWFFAKRKDQRWCGRESRPYRYRIPEPLKWRGHVTPIRGSEIVTCGQAANRTLTPMGRRKWAQTMKTKYRLGRKP